MPRTTKLAKVLLRHIASRGFDVEVAGASGSITLTARDRGTGEMHSVIRRQADIYLAACELAEMVGLAREEG